MKQKEEISFDELQPADEASLAEKVRLCDGEEGAASQLWRRQSQVLKLEVLL